MLDGIANDVFDCARYGVRAPANLEGLVGSVVAHVYIVRTRLEPGISRNLFSHLCQVCHVVGVEDLFSARERQHLGSQALEPCYLVPNALGVFRHVLGLSFQQFNGNLYAGQWCPELMGDIAKHLATHPGLRIQVFGHAVKLHGQPANFIV